MDPSEHLFGGEAGRTVAPSSKSFLAPTPIKDDQLRMVFSCCHPRLAEQAQVALMLHILCGFSVNEIANAFVSSDAAVVWLRAQKKPSRYLNL